MEVIEALIGASISTIEEPTNGGGTEAAVTSGAAVAVFSVVVGVGMLSPGFNGATIFSAKSAVKNVVNEDEVVVIVLSSEKEIEDDDDGVI